jgi:hypothetical protein
MFGLQHGLMGPRLPGHIQATTMAAIAPIERRRGLLRCAGVTPENDLEQTTKGATARVDLVDRFCVPPPTPCLWSQRQSLQIGRSDRRVF